MIFYLVSTVNEDCKLFQSKVIKSLLTFFYVLNAFGDDYLISQNFIKSLLNEPKTFSLENFKLSIKLS